MTLTIRPTSLVIALAAVTTFSGCESADPVAPEPAAVYDPGVALVRLSPGVDIATIHARYGTRTIEAIESQRVFLLDLPEAVTVDEILPAMRGDPDLRAASPNPLISAPEAQSRSTMAFADPSLHRADYTDQGAVHRIRAQEAWSRSRGGSVIVAILDTGVEQGHPDLAGSITAGGFDLVDRDPDPSDERDGIDSDGDGLVDEAYGHGTFIAGLVLGVAPDARILPLRILDSDGIGTAIDVARGIEIAVERGARVVNMSFGMAVESEVIADVIEETSNERGVTFVASAGNADTSVRQYPAANVAVLAVAAVDPEDRKAAFSNYGAWVPVAAPGLGLVAPLPPDGYGRWSGTSFATGLASGEAAVLVAFRTAATSDDVRLAIVNSAVPIDDSRMAGAGRIDVAAALDALAATVGGPDEGDEGDGGGGDEPPDDGDGDDGSDDVFAVSGIVTSIDLAGRTVVLDGGARIRVPTDETIVDGDFSSLAAVSDALAAGATIRAEATVVDEPGGLRALEIAFFVVVEPVPSFVVSGVVASVDLVERIVLLETGERILVPSDQAIAPDSEFASLAEVAAALALGTTIGAEATVIEDAGEFRALEIAFRADEG